MVLSAGCGALAAHCRASLRQLGRRSLSHRGASANAKVAAVTACTGALAAAAAAAGGCRMSCRGKSDAETTVAARRTLTDCFRDSSPAFAVSGKNVKVYNEPSEFYRAIMDGIAGAKRRIVLASLYLGSGKLENDMVELLRRKLTAAADEQPETAVGCGGLRVHVLLDHARGSRGSASGASSRHMLLPLLQQAGPGIGGVASGDQRFTLSLYHTPQLRGYLKKYMPDRFNELLGVQHIKVYLFDDTVILSGANLSNDYFTNRQDRCVVVSQAPELCDFFEDLVQCVGSFSMQVMPDNTEVTHDDCEVHPYHGHHADFTELVRQRVEGVLDRHRSRGDVVCSGNDPSTVDTWIYPVVHMGPFGVNHDLVTMERLLKSACVPGTTVSLSTAYFNVTDQYADWIVESSAAHYDIVAAAPQANGFFGAAGVAGAIPHAYTLFERAFFSHVAATKQQERVKLFEYIRSGWTFHAKGLWWYAPGESQQPSMTLVGSSNFGYRSTHRDLETQVAIITDSTDLRSALEQEKRNIFSHCYEVKESTFHEPSRQMPFWVRLVAAFVKYYA